MLALTVTNHFADYQRGDVITDPAKIAEIQESANAVNVVQVNLPDETAPAPTDKA